MIINLTDVLTAANCVREYNIDISELDIVKDGLIEIGSKSYPIRETAPVEITVTNLGNRKLQIVMKTSITMTLTCDRCLEDVETQVDVEYDEKYSFDRNGYVPVDALDNNDYITGYELDVDRLVNSEITLNMPMKVLCSEDCRGLCNRCGTNLNRASCECEHDEQLDPRLSAIRDIFEKFKEV